MREIISKFHISKRLIDRPRGSVAKQVSYTQHCPAVNTASCQASNHVLHLLIKCWPVFSFYKKVTLLLVEIARTSSASQRDSNVFSFRYRRKQVLQFIMSFSRYLIILWLCSWLEYFYHCVLLTCS